MSIKKRFDQILGCLYIFGFEEIGIFARQYLLKLEVLQAGSLSLMKSSNVLFYKISNVRQI